MQLNTVKCSDFIVYIHLHVLQHCRGLTIQMCDYSLYSNKNIQYNYTISYDSICSMTCGSRQTAFHTSTIVMDSANDMFISTANSGISDFRQAVDDTIRYKI